jgi:hypothetical protein
MGFISIAGFFIPSFLQAFQSWFNKTNGLINISFPDGDAHVIPIQGGFF